MYAKILVTLSVLIKILDCFYLEAESNYQKPKLERNNIVNKKVWVRNKGGSGFDRNNGNFIFHPNSLDLENVMQNTFDSFGVNIMQDTPFVSSYVQRTRRSPNRETKDKLKKRPKKSPSRKNGKTTKKETTIEDSAIIKSKIVSDLKPTSVFNEYPYEVAILLNNEADRVKNLTKNSNSNDNHKLGLDNQLANITNNSVRDIKEEINIIALNITNSTGIPKRSKKYDRIDEHMTKFNMLAEYNKTDTASELNKQGRNIFKNKEPKIWQQNSPLADNNFYKVVPKEPETSKSITERGLIKVITMLTKTFKKIMKQHGEIKDIHDNLLNINQNFGQKLAETISKFDDFDSKYTDMIQFNNKLKLFETELNSQKEYFDIKQKEIHNTFSDFQDQQKKFLQQQRQFYAIQKLMLVQNEKINSKQNLIAETQSQISHRQNNFARILKKAKQIVNDNKAKSDQIIVKKDKYIAKVERPYTNAVPTTTTTTLSPESMKINLFSIPVKGNKLQNKDALIIREKDEKQIDDLVYKYYFNNTFIDALMKRKILNNYAMSSDSVEIVNRSKLTKMKRTGLDTTVMLPVNNSLSDTPVKRERRWINHFSKNKYKKLNAYTKDTTDILGVEDKQGHNDTKTNQIESLNDISKLKDDPFSVMATNFCNEIGQNTNEMALKWCVEKALRRLKIMEKNAFTSPPVTVMVTQAPQPTVLTPTRNKNIVIHGEAISVLNAVSPTTLMEKSQSPPPFETVPKISPVYVVSTPAQAIFFPDNDELESNLKQYEIKPDTEGNVYYEGSLHISDYGPTPKDSGPMSDIMPGLMDSNSHVDIDPMTFDIQAKRRAFVRQFNENIMKQMKG